MAGKFKIQGDDSRMTAAVHTPSDPAHEPLNGLVVYTYPLEVGVPLTEFFADEFGNADQNVDASGAGTLTNIHNGTDTTLWTANAVGGNWNFASNKVAHTGTRSIDATGILDGDIATFTNASLLNLGDYEAVVGYIFINTWYTFGNRDLAIQLDSGGAPVGDSVSLGAYIDVNLRSTWQKFEIPIVNFSALVAQFDGLQIKVVGSSFGIVPDVHFDDLALLGAGTGARKVFSIGPPAGETWVINRIKWTAVSNNSNLKYNEFFGIPQLTEGYSLTFRNALRTSQTLTARNAFDFAQYPNTKIGIFSGTDSLYEAYFDIPQGQQQLRGDLGQKIDLIVREDLSSMIEFRCAAQGYVRRTA